MIGSFSSAILAFGACRVCGEGGDFVFSFQTFGGMATLVPHDFARPCFVAPHSTAYLT